MTHRSTNVETTRLAYLPGLDGLRAIAVLAVVLYHAQLAWVPGGFLGVDVFFVISGYLITALLLAELEAGGRVALRGFWLRRAGRLLPAALLTVAALLPLTALLLPEELARLAGDVPAALLFFSNWHFVADQRPYSEAFDRPSLLLHTWSLAIEVQFYLIWPLLLAPIYRAGRRRAVLYASLAGAALAMLAMALLFQAGATIERLYYGTDTHAIGLLIGAALAAAWRPWRARGAAARSWPLDLAGFAALAALALAFWRVYEYQDMLYRGGFALVSLLSAAAVAAAAQPRTALARLLALAPLRWVGQRSYGIYLYHWPVLVLTPPVQGPLAPAVLIGQLALVAALAELSYRFVELPVRRGALGRLAARMRPGLRGHGGRVIAAALVSSGLSLALGVWLALFGVRGAAGALPGGPPAPALPVPAPVLVPPGQDLAGSLAALLGRAAHAAGRPEPAAAASAAAVSAAPGLVRHAYKAHLVFAIGDSVMVGAAGELERRIDQLEVDARVGRQLKSAIDLVRERRATGRLGDVVIVHLGTNGYVSDEQVDELLKTLVDVRRVVVVNVRVPKRWESYNNAILASEVTHYPNAVLVDWYGATSSRPELFARDGVHPRAAGIRLYADLITAQLDSP